MLSRRCVNEYNSLADVHLQAYFSNKHLLRHLRKSGLINKRREIIPESTYRTNITRAEQRQEVKEALAQAIVHKSLDLQLKRESEIQNRLEEIAKLELVKKIRSERQQRSILLTPPSSSANGHHPAWKYFTLYRNKHENFPPSRPRTAYQRQPPRDSASVTSVETSSYNDSCSESTATTLRGSYLQAKNTKSAGVHQRKHAKTGQKKPGSSFTRYEQEKLKMSPYLYPVPGMEKPTSKLFNVQSAVRKMHHPPESMSNKRTNCLVTLKYLGTGSNIVWEEPSLGVEIVIQQQHCGGNTMCVYRNHHNTNDKFSFVSYRHLNFPYSLSIYLAGILYTRVSACCEYRHRKGTRIGGPLGLFSLVNVEGASPCARCQVNRQMMEAKKQKRPKLPEEDRTDVESVAPSLVETQISKENRKVIKREEDVKNEGNQEPCSENENKEDQHGPISFAVSGTVINVEESSSDEEDDYQDDFEDETDVAVGAKKEKQDGPDRKESSTKDFSEDDEEVVKDEDGSSEDSSSSGTEDSASSEDEKEEGENGNIRSEKEDAIHELKNRSSTNDEASSVKSKERTPSEEGNYEEDDFHKDETNNKNDKISASEMEENEHNSSLQSSSLDKNGKGEKDKDSVRSDDSSENMENETNEIKDSVDLSQQQEKDSSIKSKSVQVKTQESAGKTESNITGRSDSTSSKESSSSLPPASRKKSKMKSERRHRSNNRKKTPGSSSDSDSIAHLPAELEGTEKAKNWVPARQQETL